MSNVHTRGDLLSQRSNFTKGKVARSTQRYVADLSWVGPNTVEKPSLVKFCKRYCEQSPLRIFGEYWIVSRKKPNVRLGLQARYIPGQLTDCRITSGTIRTELLNQEYSLHVDPSVSTPPAPSVAPLDCGDVPCQGKTLGVLSLDVGDYMWRGQ